MNSLKLHLDFATVVNGLQGFERLSKGGKIGPWEERRCFFEKLWNVRICREGAL
jgi:hypothetical protein